MKRLLLVALLSAACHHDSPPSIVSFTVDDAHPASGSAVHLSYDVRGQGSSGGQAAFLGRDDIADQAAVLAWWHANVKPTKTAFYGIS